MSLAVLFQHVKDYLARCEATAQTVVAFGDREVTKQINQGTGRANRVVFAPGDDGGNLGGYGPPAKIGRNPRHLWEWQLTARVYVWAYDGAAPNDELAQWCAAVELHDRVIEAIHSCPGMPGFYRLSAPRRVGAPIERKFGYELVFLLELDQAVLGEQKPRTGAVQGLGQTLLVRPGGGTEQGC